MTGKKMLLWLCGCQREVIFEKKKQLFRNWIFRIYGWVRYILAMLNVNIFLRRCISDEYVTFIDDARIESNSNLMRGSCPHFVLAVDRSLSVNKSYRHSKAIVAGLIYLFYLELAVLILNLLGAFAHKIHSFKKIGNLLKKTIVTDVLFSTNSLLGYALENKTIPACIISGYSGRKKEEQFYVFKLSCR